MEMFRHASELKQPLRNEKLPFCHFANRQGKYYGVTINTNSLGLRDYEYSLTKPINKKRIIFLGDSFTLGWGVPLEATFSKQLERILNEKDSRYEIINMGLGNSNSVMEVELFKLKGLQLRPDLVILMYFVNDVEPTPKMLRVQYLILKDSYFLARLSSFFIKLRTIFDKNFNWHKYYKDLYSPDSKGLLSAKEAIKSLANLCKNENIKLLIVNIPELHILKGYPFTFATQYIASLAKEEDIPFLDLYSSFVAYEPSSLWVSPEDTHANSKANSIIAEEIYKKLKKDKLL